MKAIEDRLEILDLIARYSHASDGNIPEEYADNFTEDKLFMANYWYEGLPNPLIIRGSEALIEFARKTYERRGALIVRHNQCNPTIVKLSGDQALTRSYLVETVMKPGKNPTLLATGTYEHEIARTQQGWKFKKVEVIIVGRDRLTFKNE